MTTPQRSPLAEQGQFPDPEVLAADMLAAVKVNGVPLGTSKVDTVAVEAPCIRCYVPPGRRSLSRYGDLDESFVYVQTWSETRRVSQDMLQQVRALFGAFETGGVHRGVHIYRLRETTGPGQLPIQPDDVDRCVESGWTLQVRRHRGPTVR